MTKKQSYIADSIIASFDFDGVLAHGVSLKIKYAKVWFGINLSLGQTHEKEFNKYIEKLGRKDLNFRSLMDPLNEEHILEYKIPPDCIPVLTRLYAEGFRFVIITSRNDHDYPYANLFLKKKFPDLIKYLHNTRNEPKDKFVEKLMPRVHIDDDLYKLQALAHLPLELVYFRQPENIGVEIPTNERHRITEVSTFREYYTFLHTMKEVHEAVCWKQDIKNVYFNIAQIFSYYKSLNPAQLNTLLEEYRSFLAEQRQAA